MTYVIPSANGKRKRKIVLERSTLATDRVFLAEIGFYDKPYCGSHLTLESAIELCDGLNEILGVENSVPKPLIEAIEKLRDESPYAWHDALHNDNSSHHPEIRSVLEVALGLGILERPKPKLEDYTSPNVPQGYETILMRFIRLRGKVPSLTDLEIWSNRAISARLDSPDEPHVTVVMSKLDPRHHKNASPSYVNAYRVGLLDAAGLE